MTTSAPRVPTFAHINGCRHRTPVGSVLTGYTLGPRWARIALDRDYCWLPEKTWPDGATRPLMAQLASDMSTLFVYSHSSRTCYVGSFTSDLETLHTPIRCADAIVAVLVIAELGDTSLANWFGPVVHQAAERLRAIPTRRERIAMAGRITDEMAQTIARMWPQSVSLRPSINPMTEEPRRHAQT